MRRPPPGPNTGTATITGVIIAGTGTITTATGTTIIIIIIIITTVTGADGSFPSPFSLSLRREAGKRAGATGDQFSRRPHLISWITLPGKRGGGALGEAATF
jgi:hypothetical protein